MRKHWILGASAIILASSVLACGKKQEDVSTTAQGTEKAAETTAAAEEKADYVFVKMTVPYADFYYGELKDIAPEEGKDVKAQLDAEDKVAKDGFRETGMYDSVSSPTKEKVEKFVMADGAVEGEGSVYKGIKHVNVAILKSLYEDAKKALEEKKESKNALLTLMGVIESEVSTEPKEYKVLNSDGTLSKTQGTTTEAKDAKADITTTSSYGNYEIDVDGLDIDSEIVQGAILETKDGAKYGLKHEDNIWLKPEELAFSAVAFEDKNHKAQKEFKRFEDLQDKDIVKITYFLMDEDDVEIPVDLHVKKIAPAEYSVSGDEKVSYSPEGTKVNYQLSTGEDSYSLSKVLSKKSEVKGDVNTETAGVLVLPKEMTPGKYQLVFSNDNLSDVSFTVLVESGLKAEDFHFENNKLSLADNADQLTIANYIASTSSATIGEQEYKGGAGRRFGKNIFNEDGSVNTDATYKKDDKEVKYFDGPGTYPVSIKADGYPDVQFEVVVQ